MVGSQLYSSGAILRLCQPGSKRHEVLDSERRTLKVLCIQDYVILHFRHEQMQEFPSQLSSALAAQALSSSHFFRLLHTACIIPSAHLQLVSRAQHKLDQKKNNGITSISSGLERVLHTPCTHCATLSYFGSYGHCFLPVVQWSINCLFSNFSCYLGLREGCLKGRSGDEGSNDVRSAWTVQKCLLSLFFPPWKHLKRIARCTC